VISRRIDFKASRMRLNHSGATHRDAFQHKSWERLRGLKIILHLALLVL
jgi:hypothetical protein